ncbi:MAG: PxKF domain-containing protein [Chloroflexota bacterium]|jgi:hypothetical protein
MRLLRSSMVALGLSLVLAGTAAAANVDQVQLDAGSGYMVVGGELGQTFTAGRTGYLVEVRLWPITDLAGETVHVRAVKDGTPQDTILASETVTTNSTNEWIRIRFDDPAMVAAGRMYVVTVTVNHYAILGVSRSGDVYTRGSMAYGDGRWQTISALDVAFQTFVTKAVGSLSWVGAKSAPAWNKTAAGQTVTVSFSLGGDWGTKVVKGGWPKVRRVSCTTGKPIAGTEWQTRPLGGDLAYSDATETYSLSWKVPAAWGSGAMACRELRVQLIDGSVHNLFFRFRAPA